MSDVRTALVIGGGIAGPVAAMALQKAGIEPTVYEAYPSPATTIGGALAIAPNGVAALATIGARGAVLEQAIPISAQVMAVGGRRIEMPKLEGLPPLQMVDRTGLHLALHDAATARGIPVVHGARLVGAEQGPDGVTATFADGRTATADVLVGADGVRSTVRKLIDRDAPGPDFTGLLGFEGLAEHEVDARPETMTFSFGKKAYYLYWPEPGGGTRWGANLPYDRPLSLTEAREVPTAKWWEILRETYADDDPGAALVRSTPVESLGVTGALHIMPKVPHWHRGRMVLVGDSAHAPSNSSGQGASLAIESAVELARCLRDLPDVPSAFAAFEGMRRDRVEGIAGRAARINHAKAPGPFARAVMGALMPLVTRVAMNPEKMLGPEQRYTIDFDAPVAPTTAAARTRR
jgi:2-polyprenyl-6-methoxyphenol hydroxylase-like FAD-dependent oxidoreductase